MNGAPQHAFAFSVNDADGRNVVFEAGVDIVGNQRSKVGRFECVEVQNAVDGKFNGFLCGFLFLFGLMLFLFF